MFTSRASTALLLLSLGGAAAQTSAPSEMPSLAPTVVESAAPSTAPEAANLFFSAYVEGSGANRAFEVFNGEGDPVDLSEYIVLFYADGATSPSASISLGSSLLPAGEVLVVADAGADAELLAKANATFTGAAFDGNDVLELIFGADESGEAIDVVGDLGSAAAWDACGVPSAGANRTLLRKAEVTEGELDWDVSAGEDAATCGWILLSEDDFAFIGVAPDDVEISDAPSLQSTGAPSSGPTALPTAAPSASPSEAPSAAPTVSPTPEPSLSPSVAPSLAPSAAPSDLPSASPSWSPSAAPTVSQAPSSGPSPSPSMAPTVTAPPSNLPSEVPSEMPTTSAFPTGAPSYAPSEDPSAAPSEAPSAAPSEAPTATAAPSASSMPSPAPATDGTAAPTLFPTATPIVDLSFSLNGSSIGSQLAGGASIASLISQIESGIVSALDVDMEGEIDAVVTLTLSEDSTMTMGAAIEDAQTVLEAIEGARCGDLEDADCSASERARRLRLREARRLQADDELPFSAVLRLTEENGDLQGVSVSNTSAFLMAANGILAEDGLAATGVEPPLTSVSVDAGVFQVPGSDFSQEDLEAVQNAAADGDSIAEEIAEATGDDSLVVSPISAVFCADPGCSGNGECVSGVCECDAGFVGGSCETEAAADGGDDDDGLSDAELGAIIGCSIFAGLCVLGGGVYAAKNRGGAQELRDSA